MPEPDNILDVDFDSQMQGLFKQAEKALGSRAGAEADDSMKITVASMGDDETLAAGGTAPVPPSGGVGSALRPVLLGLEAVTRAAGEQSQLLARIEKVAVAEAEAKQDLPKIVAELKAMIETKNGLSQSMFTALHQELKGYKDSFLVQTVHRPIIRDLISLHDDLVEILRQVREALSDSRREATDSAPALAVIERVETIETNLAHNVEFVIEVLARFEVALSPNGAGKLDKVMQRVVAVEDADHPDEDALVVRSLKPGFLWNDRILRPEEVVVKKWRKTPAGGAEPTAA